MFPSYCALFKYAKKLKYILAKHVIFVRWVRYCCV